MAAGVSAGVKKVSPSDGAMNGYPQIVEHFVRIARANYGNVVRIDNLCHLAKANPRTISRAFKVVHGTTPSRYRPRGSTSGRWVQSLSIQAI